MLKMFFPKMSKKSVYCHYIADYFSTDRMNNDFTFIQTTGLNDDLGNVAAKTYFLA